MKRVFEPLEDYSMVMQISEQVIAEMDSLTPDAKLVTQLSSLQMEIAYKSLWLYCFAIEEIKRRSK